MFNTIREYINKQVDSTNAINKYIKNIRKISKHKKIVVGHLHKYVHKDNVIVLDTFMDNFKTYNINGYYIIADTHIKNESTDKYINKILINLQKHNNKTIILLGDIFDLWVSDSNKMVKNKLIHKLIKYINDNDNIIYIKGNHDWDITKYFYIKSIYTKYEDNNIIFYHGHQFDDFFTNSIIGKLFYYIELKFGDKLYYINNILKSLFIK